ncbi:hypothetical protein DICPUDRAFT_151074 [Dictyostelium purpureum]|uniref:Uncharacterized protein n=1 Tax=Dictyostelium purpureum TaxID=5786 RepID=F0ZHX7_DICPU|nr:uncharacterized protein DICPUDRAFT_151074 [Dictyostelium purpureum]EGC36443.1 hypothetical protein DICPUDRAFT_151074 [Dictyostelium purpureum]|eukprot:XP_003287015.1 hypothetical protein DICPUDRAFT_151074 [Dictyostelium purpureum]
MSEYKFINFPHFVIRKIFRELEHSGPKLYGLKRYSTETTINGIHFCNSTSVQFIYLSLVSKDWANHIIPNIEIPWYVANERDFYFYNLWSTKGIFNNIYKPIVFDVERIVFQTADDQYQYPSIPKSIKNIYNFEIHQLVQEVPYEMPQDESEIFSRFRFNHLKHLKVSLYHLFISANTTHYYPTFAIPSKEVLKDNETFIDFARVNSKIENLELTGTRGVIINVGFLSKLLTGSIKKLKISSSSLYFENELLEEPVDGTTTIVPVLDFMQNMIKANLFFRLQSLKLINTNISSDFIALTNLKELKLSNSIGYIGRIIEKMHTNQTLKVLSITEKITQNNNIVLKAIKKLFETNNTLEKITLDFSVTYDPQDITQDSIYGDSMNLIVSVTSDSLKRLKIISNTNVIIQSAPLLERLIIIDKQINKSHTNNSICDYKELPKLTHFGFIGKITNQPLKEFLLNLNNSNILYLEPFQIINKNNNNNNQFSIINLLNNSKDFKIRNLKINIDNNLFVYNLIQSLSQVSSIEHLELTLGFSVYYKENEKKCIALLIQELLYSLLTQENSTKSLKSIRITNNNIEICKCENSNNSCKSFIGQFNLIDIIHKNNHITLHLPSILKRSLTPHFENNNNSIKISNVSVNRW